VEHEIATNLPASSFQTSGLKLAARSPNLWNPTDSVKENAFVQQRRKRDALRIALNVDANGYAREQHCVS
jgi:hypothetical protein